MCDLSFYWSFHDQNISNITLLQAAARPAQSHFDKKKMRKKLRRNQYCGEFYFVTKIQYLSFYLSFFPFSVTGARILGQILINCLIKRFIKLQWISFAQVSSVQKNDCKIYSVQWDCPGAKTRSLEERTKVVNFKK